MNLLGDVQGDSANESTAKVTQLSDSEVWAHMHVTHHHMDLLIVLCICGKDETYSAHLTYVFKDKSS